MREGKRIAVHCHAGRGRTGLVIAAYLIYSQNYKAIDAIKFFKEKRSGSALNKKDQIQTLIDFEDCKISRIF